MFTNPLPQLSIPLPKINFDPQQSAVINEISTQAMFMNKVARKTFFYDLLLMPSYTEDKIKKLEAVISYHSKKEILETNEIKYYLWHMLTHTAMSINTKLANIQEELLPKVAVTFRKGFTGEDVLAWMYLQHSVRHEVFIEVQNFTPQQIEAVRLAIKSLPCKFYILFQITYDDSISELTELLKDLKIPKLRIQDVDDHLCNSSKEKLFTLFTAIKTAGVETLLFTHLSLKNYNSDDFSAALSMLCLCAIF